MQFVFHGPLKHLRRISLKHEKNRADFHVKFSATLKEKFKKSKINDST